ncbi:MAG: hypothetical protein ABII71_05025 [Candidatus Micrarchaeota archaeon]
MRLMVLLVIGILLFGCITPSAPGEGPQAEAPPGGEPPGQGTSIEAPGLPEYIPGELIAPSDLVYLGAFRLPGESGGSNWLWSGYAATYYPDGDAAGADDGFPGSIFAVGHDHHQMVSEISIPVPVISDNIEELNTAETLQPFADITGGMFGELEIPRAGLQYLPAQDGQDSGKLYFSWGQHLEGENNPTHGWSELDLSNPRTAGPWYVDGWSSYTTNDYMFEIPQEWASANTPGLRLATGRFRDGLWSGRGPALYAIGPYNEGNPPEPGSTLEQVTPLLLYGEEGVDSLVIVSDESQAMDRFAESDEWSGGAWLTSGEKSAMILVGTKGMGNTWYGFSNGVVWPTSGDPGEAYPEVPDWPHDGRGWWSESIQAQILFFDPAGLASVARGEMETWEPQPYAVMSIDNVLFEPGYDYEMDKMYSLGAAAYDQENGLLYIFERLADADGNSIVHAWKVG